jgi:hypothetical protein
MKYSHSSPFKTETLASVQALDPELLIQPDARSIVVAAADIMEQITQAYGSPEQPKLHSGTVHQNVLMAMHNAGPDGHTSVGQGGAGVPRNALRISQEINRATRMPVCGPLFRAKTFYAAAAHDRFQLCGRSLLQPTDGDERLSADFARHHFPLQGDAIQHADDVFGQVMATAYDPGKGTQNVDYRLFERYPNDARALEVTLGQEIVAAADLLHIATRRGVLTATEFALEMLTMQDQTVHERLQRDGIDPATLTLEGLFLVIDRDSTARDNFRALMASQPSFARSVRYTDQAIRQVAKVGIEEVFDERQPNALILEDFNTQLQEGATVRSLWLQARTLAGYPEPKKT